MAKRQPKSISVDKREGQVTQEGGPLANFFLRNVPVWNPPSWQEAETWRKIVELQQVAVICRDTIANYLNSLDWAIVARDSEKRDELKGAIKHYTKLFERGNAFYYDLDFSSHVEWIVKDLFTLPFGAASEIGRVDNNPSGRVVWVRPLDGGTLAPTLNFDFPIMQTPVTGVQPIFLPRQFVSRVFLSPRTEIRREGWGYAPPERILRSITMLSTGDDYYAKLLLNTPEAGILDLGDMAKDDAIQWIKSLRDWFVGVSPFKIPVLYEHTTKTDWIPFGHPPSEIMYDSVTMKYAAICTAGYGMTLSDIGFPSSSNGGETLAGTIRMERVGKSSGKGIAKKKLEAYFNRILPNSLQFTWIDYDDERNVSKGRARLASAQAAQIWVTQKVFLPEELRRQAIADGLMSVDVPEKIDPNDPGFPQPISPFGAPVQAKQGGSKGQSLGNPKNPSQGGQGEKIPQQIIQRNQTNAEVGISKAIYQSNDILLTMLSKVQSNLSAEELNVWEEYVDGYLTGKSEIEEDNLRGVLNSVKQKTAESLVGQTWASEFSQGLASTILQDVTFEESNKRFYAAKAQKEQDFIEGKADDIEEVSVSVDFTDSYKDLEAFTRDSLVDTVAKYGILVAKSYILEGKLAVDATEAVSNNIRVSREISQEVLRNLSQIVNSVYEYGKQYLQKTIGEKDAIS